MIISDTAVKNSIAVVVLACLILVFGTYCYLVLPRESEPDITIPNVFISTEYRGVSAPDIETGVTVKIENKLKGLDGLKKIQSISSEGNSSINIEFVTGTDISKALQDVKDKVDEAMGDLPTDLDEDPSVFEVNFSELPIVIYSLSGTCGMPCLKKIADDLEDEIEAIVGVLEVDVTGGLEREIRVEVSPEKLSYYGLSFIDLRDAVQRENLNTSGGVFRLGAGRFLLRVPGEFTSPEEIFWLVVGTHQGQPVYLKDVAQVVDSFKEEASRARLNGREAVNIAVKKRTGENIIAISREIDRVIDIQRSNWPQGTEITKVLDKAKDINIMVADLENNILSGLVLVLLVIFFVMGLRNAILVSLAIPFSMLISFTVLYAMGITLNMVVLFSLTLGLGMLVDNAVVIVENIHRFIEQGASRVDAAMKATSEVAYPVICSTLTTLSAFVPMLFWSGIMGEFMRFLPLTLIVTLSSSLFVALVINPALASLFMEEKQRPDTGRSGQSAALSVESPVAINTFLLRHYDRLLRFCLTRPLAVIGSAFALLVVMVQGWLLVIGLEKPVEFFPDIDPKGIYVNVETPEGADLEYIDQVLRRVEMAVAGADIGTVVADDFDRDDYERTLRPRDRVNASGVPFRGPGDLENIEMVYTKGVVSPGPGSGFEANAPNHVGVRFLDLQDRLESSYRTVETIRERIQTIPGGIITVAMEEQGPPTGAAINIEIAGDDFAVLGEIARRIRAILVEIPHVKDVRDDFNEGTPSVQVRVDRQKAALFGLTTDSIGFALKTAYNGLDVSTFREGNEDFDITVQLAEENRQVMDVLNELIIPAPSGHLVPLSTLAEVRFAGSIGDIIRINSERVVTVKANVDETITTGPVARASAEKLLETLPLPPGYKVTFTGEFEFQQESEEFLAKAFIVALLLIFLVLVGQFNSVSQPFLIMTSVLLSLGGAFLGLMLFRQPFGIIMTGVGVISLAGVVVNNAIVLIDYTNKLRARGFALKEAVVRAGATRLRPVLLTAVTTILGLVPMITGVSYDFHIMAISWVSESSLWWRSMAVVVVFGLVIATFLTLVVVPSMYYLLARSHEELSLWSTRIRRWYWDLFARLSGENLNP
ncbi:efflux RND transporter permease subunit [Desulfobulbus alkaliphilus]|uniref:efflux RND transporter permease subunit n=1 Tax=Desulfobulbus alkaliphilus TaxID=869814 RepID=UPI001962AE06|nr:efflux RND transporter permease subunit [Desulfobulbus alkaliphilus]MBM9535504.1 efflux RND transporter permease subunit [Desulfobulbus alkaliphilus]